MDSEDILDIVNEVVGKIPQMVKGTKGRIKIIDITENALDESVNKDQDVMESNE